MHVPGETRPEEEGKISGEHERLQQQRRQEEEEEVVVEERNRDDALPGVTSTHHLYQQRSGGGENRDEWSVIDIAMKCAVAACVIYAIAVEGSIFLRNMRATSRKRPR